MASPEKQLAELLRLPILSAFLEVSRGPVYLVGGSVRDLLLSRAVKDLDVVVTESFEETAIETATRLGIHAAPMGRKPLNTYRLAHEGMILDIAPLQGSTIEADLSRRDMTINAMALELKTDPASFRVIDPCGGLQDVEQITARFVSEANVLADPVRMLRLFRLCVLLKLTPDPSSLDLVRKHASLIKNAAGERTSEEMLALLDAPKCGPVIRQMYGNGLLPAIFPEMAPLEGCFQGGHHHLDVLEHTFLALESLEKVITHPGDYLPAHAAEIRAYLDRDRHPALLKMAVLLHDLGKPDTRTKDPAGHMHFIGHDKAGEVHVEAICARLRVSAADTRLLRFLVRRHLHLFHLLVAFLNNQLTPKGIFRFGRMAGQDLWGLTLHTLADAMATKGKASLGKGGLSVLLDFVNDLLDELSRQQKAVDRAPRLVTGHHIMAEFDMKGSPLIGRLLDRVEEAQALALVKTKSEALALVEQALKNGLSDD